MEEQQKSLKESSSREKTVTRVVTAVAFILFIAAAILGWQFLEQRSITAMEKAEKDSVQTELNDLLGQYEKLNTNNKELTQQLGEEKEKIRNMLEEVKKLKADSQLLKKYKKESETLRTLLRGYLVEIDSLNSTITVLHEEKTKVETDLGKERSKAKKLSEEKKELTEKVDLASQLRASNIIVHGLRLRSGGKKEREEIRAKRVEVLKTCFMIDANPLAKSGEREVYIRISDKNGDVFPKDGDSTNVFSFKGKDIAYSIKKNLNYQNLQTEMCMYFKKNVFTPQVYHVDIFTDGLQIGDAELTLEK